MIVVSYDIENDKLRNKFMKMLIRNGAIRLQFSVYEVNNTRRVVDNITIKINEFSRFFTNDDSVVLFEVNEQSIQKYGNDIHRDKEILYFEQTMCCAINQ